MDLFKLVGTIALNGADQAKKDLDDVTNKAKQTGNEFEETSSKGEGKLSSAFSKVGKGAVALGKTVVKGMAVAGAGVSALVTSATSSYAEYEQLVGGVETLFGDSAKKVIKYADEAFQTAGLSANDYMSTVTSFSASLLQSLDGDTAAAADKANQAIIDMSDNANKMGTSMESIQNAYQGFAKQNYTMLDNLKLGYGGTKEEMQRLLSDAEKISGKKFDLSSYADVVDAIHVIQTEMGIAGTTAEEAAGTMSGSMAAVKGAWQNLLTAMASDDLDLDVYMNGFVNSVSTMLENMLPRIQIALGGVVSLINELAPKIIETLPQLVSTLLPAIIDAATGLINALVSAFPGILTALIDILPSLINGIQEIFNALIQALPQIMETLVSALPTLIPMLVDALVAMFVLLCTMLPEIIQPIIDNLPMIIETIVMALLQNLPILLAGIGQLIMGIIQAIPQLLSGLWESITSLASQFAENLFSKIEGWIRQLFPKSADTVLAILKTIQDYFSTLVKNIGEILSVVVSVISVPFKLAWNGVKLVWDNCVSFFKMIWNNIKAIFSVVDSVLAGDFRGAWNGIKSIWSNVVGYFKDIISNVKNAFSNVYDILSSPFKKAKDAIKNIVDNIKGFFSGLKLSFPGIKLPHFSIKPKGWKIGDLLEGSIPKLGIDWYAKAMRNPMIMNQPTVFGYDASTGKLQGGGEAGSEVVSGTNTLMNMISSAVATQNSEMVYYLQRLIQILAEYFPQVLEGMDRAIVLDSGEMVGALAPAMDARLGKMAIRSGRGVY